MIDASLALDLCLMTNDADQLAERLKVEGGRLAAPEVIDLEILQALRRQERIGAMAPARVEAALDIFRFMPLERFTHAPFIGRIWALRANLTAYDAAYFALAEALEAPL